VTGALVPSTRSGLGMVTAASGSIVMGLGIVCADLQSDHQATLSLIALWLSAGIWLVLTVVLALRLLVDLGGVIRGTSSPAALTSAAGTAVLGTTFAVHGYHQLAVGLLAVAAAVWALLVVPVLACWKTPTTGLSFVLAVATEGLAVLGAILAVIDRAAWLIAGSLAAFILGLVFYLLTAIRFQPSQLLIGHGDQWIAGGAVAISALACAKTAAAVQALGQFAPQQGILACGALALWCLAMLWLVPLIAAEILRPRLRYNIRRWATVFPVGMYAACSFAVGQVSGISGISAFASVWTWLAVIASLLALNGLVRRIWRALGGGPPSRSTPKAQ
jgi:Voltage-dependent anion channel